MLSLRRRFAAPVAEGLVIRQTHGNESAVSESAPGQSVPGRETGGYLKIKTIGADWSVACWSKSVLLRKLSAREAGRQVLTRATSLR